MKKSGILVLMFLAGVGTVSAQRYDIGGSVIDMNGITALDMFNYSQTSHNFGTARSMAMGGALTSLGGDMASMSINPAGLGMYRTNEITLTPMVGVARASTDASPYESNTSTRFSMANFGFIFKAYEGMGKVLAVNIGFGYNRLADFNYNTSFYRGGNQNGHSEEGIGLGLAIVKHVALTHRGSASVWSAPGQGSTFTLELPVARN